jgi:Tol biopolymer transport system component
MKRKPLVLLLAAVATASLALAASSLGAAGTVVLVSGPNAEIAGGFPSEQINPAISGDGRYVAFVGDVPGESELGATGTGVFLRDISAGIVPVDIPHGSSEQGIDFSAGSPSLSAGGRFLAFASEDPDLSDEDRNSSTTPAGYTYPVRDIFVYDRSSGAVSLVSRANGIKGVAGNEDSNLPSISADGRYVAFQTEATNFLHGSYGGIFVRDLHRNTTTPAAWVRLHPGGALNGGYTPSISAHGRWVAFLTSTHFRHGNALEVAVRDMDGKRTVYASRADGRHGALAADDCKLPAISANSRYVAFATKARNLSGIDKDSVEDVFVRDLKTNLTMLVSRARGRHGAAGNGDSSNPSISADGRYVAFESYASNLGPHDNSTIPDVFVRDMRSGRVFLASRAGAGGPAANAPSANPAISANGRYVAFDSRGSNLDPADTLHPTSIFRFQLLP